MLFTRSTTAEAFVGAAGFAAGVAETTSEATEFPTALTATTVKSYDVPLVRLAEELLIVQDVADVVVQTTTPLL